MDIPLSELQALAESFSQTNQDQFERLQEDYRHPTPRTPEASVRFLGTGQGTHHIAARGVLNHGARRVSGPIISSANSSVWIDPGPDALAVLDRDGLDARHVDGLLISHAHVDHFGNVLCAVEAISGATEIKKHKVVYGNITAIDGAPGSPKIISDYHSLNILRECRSLRPFESVEIGDLKVTAWPCAHRETKNSDASLNWKIEVPVGTRRCSIVHFDGNVFGLEGDDPGSSPLDFVSTEVEGADLLIVNVSNHIRVKTSRQNYVSTSGLNYLARRTTARTIFTTHFGIEMFRVSDPELSLLQRYGFESIADFQACYVRTELKAAGIEKSIIAARDGVFVRLTPSTFEVSFPGGELSRLPW